MNLPWGEHEKFLKWNLDTLVGDYDQIDLVAYPINHPTAMLTNKPLRIASRHARQFADEHNSPTR